MNEHAAGWENEIIAAILGSPTILLEAGNPPGGSEEG